MLLKDFIVHWLAHLSERSVRLHGYLAQVSATAPRVSDRPPAVVLSMLTDAETLAEAIRQRAKQVATKPLITDADLCITYSGAQQYATRFLTLHARLSHLPKEWVRPEIELFMRSVSSAANREVQSLLRRGTSFLENYTIVPTPSYNFANLLDEADLPSHDDYNSGTIPRDLLSLPAIEQHSTLFWPLLVHELGHSLFRPSRIYEEPSILRFIAATPASYRPLLRDHFLEEIFCDLLAASITGPMYYVSFTLFANYWAKSPLRIATTAHPAPATRLQYLASFLLETNHEIMNEIQPRLDAAIKHRMFLDYLSNSQDVNENAELIRREHLPPEQDVLVLANLICNSDRFKILTKPCYQTNIKTTIPLQNKFARGEFIGTSRAVNIPAEPVEVERIIENFDKFAQALEERPNSIFDILTATSCHQAGLLLSEEQARHYRHESLQLWPDAYIFDLVCSTLDRTDFIKAASAYIHGADATAIKSLEASTFCTFFSRTPT